MSIKSGIRFVKVWIRRIGSLFLAGAIYALILTGCVSTRGIYIAQLLLPESQSTTSASSDVTVRFGYLGICVQTTGDFACSSTSESQLSNALGSNSTSIAQDIISLQSSISFLPPVIALFFFLLGLVTLCMWNLFLKRRQKLNDLHKITKLTKNVKILTIATRGLFWLSTALALAAAYSTTSTISALRLTASILKTQNSGAEITEGIAVQVLQWAAFVMTGALALYIQFWFKPSYESELPTSTNPFGNSPSTAQLLPPAPTFAPPKQEDYNFPPPPQNY